MDPHRNIFFYYRGPSRRRDDQWDRQIENNLTKAFINISEFTDSRVVTGPFLELVGLSPGRGLRSEQIRYGIQSPPMGAPEAKHRVLVTITPDGEMDPGVLAEDLRRAQPDAWVYLPGQSTAVMIEVKLRDRLSEAQLKNHLRHYKWSDDTSIQHVKWLTLYDTLRLALRHDSGESRILVDHFLQLLEYLGMAPFSGINNHDFEFLYRPEAAYRPILRSHLEAFGHAVRDRLSDSLQMKYPDVEVGRLVVTQWMRPNVRINRRHVEKEPFKSTNLTLELDSDGLWFNAVLRDGRVTNRRSAMGQTVRMMDAHPKEFTRLISDLGVGFWIRLFSREGLHGGRPNQANEVWIPKAWFSSETFDSQAYAAFRSMLDRIDFPGIHVGRLLKRQEIDESDPEPLLNMATDALTKVAPVISFAEGQE